MHVNHYVNDVSISMDFHAFPNVLWISYIASVHAMADV